MHYVRNRNSKRARQDRRRKGYPVPSRTKDNPNERCYLCDSSDCAGVYLVKDCWIYEYRQALADEYNSAFPKGPAKTAEDFEYFEVITSRTLRLTRMHLRNVDYRRFRTSNVRRDD